MKTLLLNPFKRYQENTLFTIGTLGLVLGSALAYPMLARFDGVIDLHFVPHVTIWQPFLDNCINTLLLTGLLFMIGRYLNPKTRLIDMLNASLLARIPYYILPLFNFNNTVGNAGTEITDALVLSGTISPTDISSQALLITAFFAFLSIGGLIWYVTLLYNGYKIASNAKGTRPIVLFCIALIVAEIFSKIIITSVPY